MINLNKFRDNKLFILLIIVLFSLIYFYPLYTRQDFSYDSLRFFSIDKIQNVFSFDYVSSMFMKGTNGPQYRPLSFFVYQLYTKALFGNQIWMYVVLGIIYVLISSYLIFKILKLHGVNRFFSYLGSFLFLIHPMHLTLLGNALIPKYPLPAMILLLGVYLCSRSQMLTYRDVILLSILQAICIMTHEGAITFSTIWLLTLIYRLPINDLINKYKKVLIFFLPSFIYFIIRVVVHSIPSEGFMKVSLDNSFMNLAYYFSTFVIPYSPKMLAMPAPGHIDIIKKACLLFFIFVGLFLSLFKRKHTVSYLMSCIVVILLPYSVLSNHVLFNRAVWEIPFIIIIIIHLFNFIYYHFKTRIRFLPIILITGFLFYYSFVSREYLKQWHEVRNKIYTGFITDMNEKLSANKSTEGEILIVHVLPKNISALAPMYFFSILPAALVSRHSPELDQAILWFNHPKITHKYVFIKGGTYYRIVSQDKNSILTLDLFENEVRFPIKNLEKKIEDIEPTFRVYF